MARSSGIFVVMILLTAIIAGCARAQKPKPAYYDAQASKPRVFVAPQSGPVLPPSYPTLGGELVQPRTASIPIIQGR